MLQLKEALGYKNKPMTSMSTSASAPCRSWQCLLDVLLRTWRLHDSAISQDSIRNIRLERTRTSKESTSSQSEESSAHSVSQRQSLCLEQRLHCR